ncbi:MAG: DUF1702 family protein [Proteobacteria bacterium]|nr:DUF1702 family protein [Pseudomonadota bacterium]
MGWLTKKLFGIAPKETRFDYRGFEGGGPRIRQRIEQIGATFAIGYHAALLNDEPHSLAETLNREVESELRGFAFEGAGMGLAITDFIHPFRPSRWQAFLAGPGAHHVYMLHVGAGWALARLPVPLERATLRMDPLLRWLAIDGYGFHQGYFHNPRFIGRQEEPQRLSAYGRCAFDQGLGRSLWFVKAGDPERVAAAISAFAPARRPHLWSGVGLACAYAGGVERPVLETLRELSGGFLPQLAQGVAFAAKARQRAGNPAAHTELACAIVCGMSADNAAAVTDLALDGLRFGGDDMPAYESWRQKIQSLLVG